MVVIPKIGVYAPHSPKLVNCLRFNSKLTKMLRWCSWNRRISEIWNRYGVCAYDCVCVDEASCDCCCPLFQRVDSLTRENSSVENVVAGRENTYTHIHTHTERGETPNDDRKRTGFVFVASLPSLASARFVADAPLKLSPPLICCLSIQSMSIGALAVCPLLPQFNRSKSVHICHTMRVYDHMTAPNCD